MWVLVRTNSLRRFLRVSTIYVLSKNKKNKIFHLKIIIFTAVKYQNILHRRVFVMISGPFEYQNIGCFKAEDGNTIKEASFVFVKDNSPRKCADACLSMGRSDLHCCSHITVNSL